MKAPRQTIGVLQWGWGRPMRQRRLPCLACFVRIAGKALTPPGCPAPPGGGVMEPGCEFMRPRLAKARVMCSHVEFFSCNFAAHHMQALRKPARLAVLSAPRTEGKAVRKVRACSGQPVSVNTLLYIVDGRGELQELGAFGCS